MDSADLPTFSLGLDTPSKYLGGPSTGLTPASWSLGTGFTPSILGGYSASGWTPSLTAAAGAKAEFNPFEVSLNASSSSSKRRTFTTDFLDRDEAAPKGSTDSVFDLLATTPGTGGRKRALSSPAVEMGAGHSSFPFLSQPSQFNPDPSSLSTAAVDRRAKRPRMASMQSSNLTSQETFFSSFERESDESPASSVVLTPPDSAPTFAGGSTAAKDIAVAAKQAHSNQPPPPPNQAQPQQPLSALSRLAQERSALIARGQTVLSQASPLPIKQAPSSARPTAPIAQADISVKAEPTEDLIASSQPESASKSAPARRPPVTRGQSRRGARSTIAVGSAAGSSRDLASPSPATSLPTKRKAPRKKSSTTTATKKKEASVAAEDDDDDEEGPEGSDKRQQFLERNRVAACKSRQKKKEKVAGLEQFAADLCARNNILQQTAFALRQEALALRQLVHAHVGCSCEHAQGYIARDAAGGGIATIDQLAGRTLKLDYSIPPAMGTEDDVYSFIDNGSAAPAGMLDSPERGKSLVPAAAPGPAIPIVARPTAVGPSTSSSPVRRAGMTTRRSSQAVQHAQRASYGGGNGGRTAGGDAAFRAAVQNNHLGLSMNGVPMDADLASSMLANGMRATSAPPTTPGWGDAAPSGDYFAPKRRSIAVVA